MTCRRAVRRSRALRVYRAAGHDVPVTVEGTTDGRVEPPHPGRHGRGRRRSRGASGDEGSRHSGGLPIDQPGLRQGAPCREVNVMVGERRRRLRPGGLTVVPAEEPHDVIGVGDEPARILGVFGSSTIVSVFDDEWVPSGTRVLGASWPARASAASIRSASATTAASSSTSARRSRPIAGRSPSMCATTPFRAAMRRTGARAQRLRLRPSSRRFARQAMRLIVPGRAAGCGVACRSCRARRERSPMRSERSMRRPTSSTVAAE
jgi:hypothetical protein